MSGIYQIRNLVNGKIYIGSAVDIQARWSVHKNQLKKRTHHNIHLQRAWDKYGPDNFTFEILEGCSQNNLLEREQHYLDMLQIGYNINKKANSRLGAVLTTETKLKISKSVSGFKHTEEARQKMRDNHPRLSGKNHPGFGKTLSEEHKKKLKDNHPRLSGKAHPGFGKSLSKEHKKKLSDALSGNKNPMFGRSSKDLIIEKYGLDVGLTKWKEMNSKRSSNGKNKGVKAVLQIDDSDCIVAEFISLTEAAKITGINLSSIQRVCGGYRKTAGKFQWKYKNI